MSRLFNFRNISRGLTAVAIAALVWMLISADFIGLLGELDAQAFAIIAIATVALTVSWLAPGLAWARLVDALAKPSHLGGGEHVAIYAQTQIQKYVPGNIFHFILRHIESRRRGERDEPLFWACVGELVGQMAAAGIIAALALGLAVAFPNILFATLLLLSVLVGIYFLLRITQDLLPLAVRVLVRLAGTRGKEWHAGVDLNSAKLTPRQIGAALPLYAIYIVALGIVAWSLGLAVDEQALSAALIPFVIGATAIAWIAGFVLPGAPGGLGPREAVLAGALAIVAPVETALFIALALRLCTVLSDLFFFLGGKIAASVPGVIKSRE